MGNGNGIRHARYAVCRPETCRKEPAYSQSRLLDFAATSHIPTKPRMKAASFAGQRLRFAGITVRRDGADQERSSKRNSEQFLRRLTNASIVSKHSVIPVLKLTRI